MTELINSYLSFYQKMKKKIYIYIKYIFPINIKILISSFEAHNNTLNSTNITNNT